MDNMVDIKYQMFLAEEIEEQGKFEAFLNEAILISENENTIENINILNEAFSDKLKSGISKLILVFKGMWEKFIEMMNTLVKKDKDYLDKYKDIILKKALNQKAEYSMYNYSKGVSNIVNSPIPAYNFNALKDKLVDAETFIKETNLRTFKIGNGGENHSDTFKSYFRGSESESWIKASQLNMTNIFNYCYGYSTMKDKIEKDKKSIVNAAEDSIKAIDKMGAEGKIKNEQFIANPKYLSYVYESYVTEAEEDKKPEPKKPDTGKMNDTVNGKSDDKKEEDKDGKGIGGGVKMKTPTQAYNGKDGDHAKTTDKDVNSEDSVTDMTNRVRVYLKVCGDVIGAKMTVSEEIYKAYMAIIKSHVRDHLGTKDSENNKPKDTATNYDSENNKDKESNNSNDNKSKESETPEKKKMKEQLKGKYNDVKQWLSKNK